MEKYIKKFLEYLEVDRDLAKATTDNYKFYLMRFTNFAKESGVHRPDQITKELVYKYRLRLNRLGKDKDEGLKKNTPKPPALPSKLRRIRCAIVMPLICL